MISFTKTARAFAAILLLCTAAAFAQSVPDDTRVIPMKRDAMSGVLKLNVKT